MPLENTSRGREKDGESIAEIRSASEAYTKERIVIVFFSNLTQY